VADARAEGRDVVKDFHGLLVELGQIPESTQAASQTQQPHDSK
jgi:hypothetical protein